MAFTQNLMGWVHHRMPWRTWNLAEEEISSCVRYWQVVCECTAGVVYGECVGTCDDDVASQKILLDMLQVFDDVLLPTHSSRYVQFILFYVASLSEVNKLCLVIKTYYTAVMMYRMSFCYTVCPVVSNRSQLNVAFYLFSAAICCHKVSVCMSQSGIVLILLNVLLKFFRYLYPMNQHKGLTLQHRRGVAVWTFTVVFDLFD